MSLEVFGDFGDEPLGLEILVNICVIAFQAVGVWDTGSGTGSGGSGSRLSKLLYLPESGEGPLHLADFEDFDERGLIVPSGLTTPASFALTSSLLAFI